MRGTAIFLLVAATTLAVPVSPAGAGVSESTCSFDEVAARVDIALVGTPNVLYRSGEDIELNGGTVCTGPTVTNTDLIVVTADPGTPNSEEVGLVIDLAPGRFAPGLTDEGPGSEVEFDVRFVPEHWPSVLTINADRGGQTISVDEQGIDLDADEPSPQNDIMISAPGDCGASTCQYIGVQTGDGRDRILERDDLAPRGRRLFVMAGAGDDIVRAHASRDGRSIIEGGSGDDVLTSDGDADLRGDLGDDLLIGGSTPGHRDDLNGGPDNDRIFGFGGRDLLSGSNGRDTIVGGGGGDIAFGGPGGDWIWGGPGRDDISGGFGFDACQPEEGWTLHRQECERALLDAPPGP